MVQSAYCKVLLKKIQTNTKLFSQLPKIPPVVTNNLHTMKATPWHWRIAVSTTTSEPAPLATTCHPRRLPRISLAQLLVLVALAGTAMGFFVQSRHLADARAALSRYESSQIPISLSDNQFRMIARTILDIGHIKVVTYRVETTTKRFATLQGTGDSTGQSLSLDPKTGLYFTEMTVAFDHLRTDKKIKMSNMGYTVKDVPADYSLDDSVILNDVSRVYDVTDTVGVFEWDGIPYSMSLK